MKADSVFDSSGELISFFSIFHLRLIVIITAISTATIRKTRQSPTASPVTTVVSKNESEFSQYAYNIL